MCQCCWIFVVPLFFIPNHIYTSCMCFFLEILDGTFGNLIYDTSIYLHERQQPYYYALHLRFRKVGEGQSLLHLKITIDFKIVRRYVAFPTVATVSSVFIKCVTWTLRRRLLKSAIFSRLCTNFLTYKSHFHQYFCFVSCNVWSFVCARRGMNWTTNTAMFQ